MLFEQAGDFILDRLEKEIPATLCYHNIDHTRDVRSAAESIGNSELISPYEMKLLLTAACYHDCGFLAVTHEHETESCNIARESLPGFGFSNEEIDRICGMIMATKMPQSPQNILEQIIADADLEYLGTPGAEEKAAKLFKELQYLTPSLTTEQWQKNQISFLKAHQYFTSFCKKNRQPVQQAYLQRLLNNIL